MMNSFLDTKNTGPLPSAYIQWKGTDVCCDITCVCGEVFHFDGYFMSSIRCPSCCVILESPAHITMRVTNDTDKYPYPREVSIDG
jgi:hypothetical protein